MHNQTYKQIDFQNPQSFWDYLSPENWQSKKSSTYIYRGQANSEWELLPNVLRKNEKLSSIIYEQTDDDLQVLLEHTILNQFIMGCDKIGLSIPNDSIYFRKNIIDLEKNDKIFMNTSIWPTDDFIDVMSLAQHYGVPTRLLDWTRRSYVAAYFAVSEALKTCIGSDAKKIAVWALDISRMALYSSVIDGENKQKFEIVRLPGSNNKNIVAQEGVFTLQRYYKRSTENKIYSSLEDIFIGTVDTPLIKMTLPIEYSIDIYKKCDLYGINAATLFPEYSGVAKYVNEQLFLMSTSHKK
jgi:hypothetical protein